MAGSVDLVAEDVWLRSVHTFDAFGEAELLLDGMRRGVSAVAAERCRLLVMPAQAYLAHWPARPAHVAALATARAFPGAAGLNARLLAVLYCALETHAVPRGAVLARQGADADAIGLLTEGTAAAYVSVPVLPPLANEFGVEITPATRVVEPVRGTGAAAAHRAPAPGAGAAASRGLPPSAFPSAPSHEAFAMSSLTNNFRCACLCSLACLERAAVLCRTAQRGAAVWWRLLVHGGRAE